VPRKPAWHNYNTSIGGTQDKSVATSNGRDGYWHSIREIFVMSGCCDAAEINFHRQYETEVCDFSDFDERVAPARGSKVIEAPPCMFPW
jgi:hypothetical protein